VARRLIGLDIGTNAVRVVELEPGSDLPRVTSFGQVALPPDAMREGEVVDRAAVTAAIQRLWKELSLRKGEVRVGVASPRVLVRTLDLPVMSEEDLAGALRFQAQELIPIPYEEAVLDFQVIEQLPVPETTGDGVPPQQMQRVLLAAAHRDMVANLVAAVRAAGLTVGAVDLVPLALIRAIGRRVSDNGSGAEAIVDIGGGATVVVVHEAGLPRFVRILGLGGRSVTDAIVRELGLPYDQAEALKRQTSQVPEDVAAQARAAMARPVGDLVEQIRGSLDYYRGQAATPRLLQVTLTGGGSLLPDIAPQLRDLVGLPVEPAEPREQLEIGDIGFPTDRVHDIDPYLPTPAGLALGGLATGRRITLLGPDGRGALGGRRTWMVAAAVAALLILLLGGIWWVRKSALDREKDQLSEVQAENARLQQERDSLSAAEQTELEIEGLQAQVERLLATDISWARMLQEIARTIPNDTWLTAFQGSSANSPGATGGTTGTTTAPSTTAPSTTPTTSTAGGVSDSSSTTSSTTTAGGTPSPGAVPGATTTPGTTAAGTVSGTVSFTVVGLDFPSVSAWIQRIGSQIPSFTNLWVPSATRGSAGSASGGEGTTTSAGGREFVNFTSNAAITSAARSDRLERVQRNRR
jgi:type IV pilus assembly protein PilM